MAYLLTLGKLDYEAGWRFQHRLWAERVKGTVDDTLILLEHPPVITLGRRADRRHLLVSESELNRRGIRVYQVERGGDITYHGPGQLIGYPIFRLEMGVRRFVELVEQALIRSLMSFNIQANIKPKLIGVWVEGKKIASVGIAVQQGVTLHGFALNVGGDLSGFGLINPCGLKPDVMTSISAELGWELKPEEVIDSVVSGFEQTFGLRFQRNLPRSLTSLTNSVSSERIRSA